MQNEPEVKLLIVDDKEENREAARRNFQHYKSISVTFGVDYESGMQEIEKGVYHAGIFDVEIPRNKGGAPERLGHELAREALEKGMAVAIITGGTDHGKDVTYACFEPLVVKGPVRQFYYGPKTSSGVWDAVYEEMLRALEPKLRQRAHLGRALSYTEMGLGSWL